MQNSASAHIEVQLQVIRDMAAEGEVMFEYCSSYNMVADCISKALSVFVFSKCLAGVEAGMHQIGKHCIKGTGTMDSFGNFTEARPPLL